MKIDTAIKEFTERYDSTAMSYIDQLSNNFGMNENRIKFSCFNITEGFDRFDEYLRGYAQYKIDNINNYDATPQEIIRESAHDFIQHHTFADKNILYREMVDFVKAYPIGIQKLTETVDTIKTNMKDANVDLEAVGDVNDFVDEFMDVLNESFIPAMERMLMASGYTNKYRPRKSVVKEKPVFL